MNLMRLLAILAFALHVPSVGAAEQVNKATRGTAINKSGEASPSQGSVTIPGSSQIFSPVSPEEAEKLGRNGIKRKMMERKR